VRGPQRLPLTQVNKVCNRLAHWRCIYRLFFSCILEVRLKNVSLIDVRIDGKRSFALLDPEGRRIAAFDAFAKSLVRAPLNTRTTYCRNLARFFDYLLEAAAHLAPSGTALTRDDVVAVLEAYREYLVYGGRSGNQVACSIDSSLPSPLVSVSTCELMHAPVRRFLELSETLRKHLEQLHRAGLTASAVDPLPLLPPPQVRRPTSHEANALRVRSMLAGVISGGPKLLTDAVLPTVKGAAPYDEKRAFPFDASVALIGAMPSWRDTALYAFCAASGCRISEALQLLWSDVQPAHGIVRLVDPARRANDASYLALEAEERDRLVWKGRATQATLLIEPFASMFFEALEQYTRREYIPHGVHQFVFQHLRSGMEGRPYFLSAASSRNQIFQAAVSACISTEHERAGLGVHSLRHMYGTYCLNYFPRSDGSYGLPMGLVKQLMGHKSIASTERYARHDLDVLEAELAYANAMVFGTAAGKSANQMKRDVLQSRLRTVEQAIEQEHAAKAIAMGARK